VSKEIFVVLGALVLIVILSGGAVWLANAPLQPPSQQTHLVLPDERISR